MGATTVGVQQYVTHFDTSMIIICSDIRAALESLPAIDPPSNVEYTIKSIQVLSHDWATVRGEQVLYGITQK